MAQNHNFSAVILAGGKSSRMKTDKADLMLGSKTFLTMQIEKARFLGIGDILVSGYRGNICSVPVVYDRIPNKGPLGGLEACLRMARHPRCLVLSVDQPLLPVSELYHLLQTSLAFHSCAVILKHSQRTEPLVAVYPAHLADALEAALLAGQTSVRTFLHSIDCQMYVSDAPEICFSNINTPADYQLCCRQLG